MVTPEAETLRQLAEKVGETEVTTAADVRDLLNAFASWMERNDRPGTRPLNTPCPHCGHEGVVNIHSIAGNPKLAVITCPECGERWQEYEHG